MRVVVAHTFEQTAAAMEAAAEAHVPLVLQSAPDAIFYAGSLYLLHMFEQAKKLYPQVNAQFILDSGEAGAEAVGAMQMGHKHLRSSAPEELKAKLADIAGQLGVTMHGEPYEALDLRQVADTKGACMQWLKERAL